ncbi:F-box/LRR-repeat protein 4-like [Diaphorina citri]|uniref:F-box/LRR-repeat protein 4-like n=1 Tax=Diaphorina citri TaxID=121845 RepID=A0A3Q0J6K0_DIACI|nr:F-box/LRR-repeat protein 4-like [Diaphorina citri]
MPSTSPPRLSSANIVKQTDVTRCQNGSFSILPDEVVLHILSYLDLVSLCRVSHLNAHLHRLATDPTLYTGLNLRRTRVSHLNAHLHRLATDPTLYTGLNLRPYWPRVNSAFLATLALRAPLLQRLDLGWCGNYGTVDVRAFTR